MTSPSLEARDAIIVQHLALAERVARRFAAKYHRDADDCISIAHEALVVLAAGNHHPDNYEAFVVTAIWRRMHDDEIRGTALRNGDCSRNPRIRRAYDAFMAANPQADLIDAALALDLDPKRLQAIVAFNPLTDTTRSLDGAVVPDYDTPDVIVERQYRADAVRRAMEMLPEGERIAVDATISRSRVEVAKRLGVSRQALSQRYLRAIARLRANAELSTWVAA